MAAEGRLLILNGDPEQPAAVRELALEVTSQFFLEERELAESFLE